MLTCRKPGRVTKVANKAGITKREVQKSVQDMPGVSQNMSHLKNRHLSLGVPNRNLKVTNMSVGVTNLSLGVHNRNLKIVWSRE